MASSAPDQRHGSAEDQSPEATTGGSSPALSPVPAGGPPVPGQEAAWQQALEDGECLHCKSPLGPGWAAEDGPFCCRGCRSVYHLLHGEGLERFYDIAQGRQAPAPQLRADSFAWLEPLLATAGAGSGGSLHLALDVQGVHCAACVWLLEKLFRRLDGGIELRINPSLGKVDLIWDPSLGDLREYLAEAERFGYRFGPPLKTVPRRSRRLLARMAICIAIALNVMTFTLGYYFGLSEGQTLYETFGWLNLVLATISVLVGGQVFFRGAISSLRRRIAHLDLPIALGIALAYLGSAWAFFTAGPEGAYFDSLTIFVALMLVGRFAQERILERNRNTLLQSSGAEQIVAKKQQGTDLVAVPAPEIKAGDELWIAPGDLVPVAAVLLKTHAQVTLDWITGESDEQLLDPGALIPAGAFNAGQQGFAVAASEDFSDSRLQDLLRSGPGGGEGAAWHPAWWSLVAGWYVLAVLGLAMIGFLAWMPQGLRPAIEVTVAILVVTCPCALGLATPLAEELTFFALRRRGVFVRHAGLMDRALAVHKILLDKTGTLTLGDLSLDQESRRALWAIEPAHRAVLRGLVSRSNHPVSQCLAGALGNPGPGELASPRIVELIESPGQGLSFSHEGQVFRLGKAEFALDSARPEGDGEIPATRTRVTFAVDGSPLAVFSFREEFKADASSEVRRLESAGYQVRLLSGDLPEKVQLAARELGLEPEAAIGGLSPEAKAAVVRDLDRQDTMMIGDGLNDSPSFEAAFCAGTPAVDRPVLPGKADFYFLGDGIAAVRWTLAAANRLRQVIRTNLAVAIVYNLVAVGLCFAGLVSPVVAAILMPLSSVAVVGLTGIRLSGRRLGW